MSDHRIATIERWLEENGVWWDENRICIDSFHGSTEPGNGLAIYARQDLNEDDIVCRIPKSAILSVKTSGIAKIIKKSALTGALALTLAVMYEKSLGEQSKWFGYLATLPDRVEGMPIFWDRKIDVNALALLDNTEVGSTVQTDMDLMRQDYNEFIRPILKAYSSHFNDIQHNFSFKTFLNVSSIVASRCFCVDGYHGDSMVPLADIFNHKTAGEHIHLESDDPGGTSSSDHCDDIEMRIVRPLKYMKSTLTNEPANEVFNTYGDHSTSYLLLKYGFTEPDLVNPYDVVSFSVDDVLNLSFFEEITELDKRVRVWKQNDTMFRSVSQRLLDQPGDDAIATDDDIDMDELLASDDEDNSWQDDSDEYEDCEDDIYFQFSRDKSNRVNVDPALICFLATVLMDTNQFDAILRLVDSTCDLDFDNTISMLKNIWEQVVGFSAIINDLARDLRTVITRLTRDRLSRYHQNVAATTKHMRDSLVVIQAEQAILHDVLTLVDPAEVGSK